METFSVLLSLCVGNSLVTGEVHAQSPVTRSFDVSFDLHLSKRWVNNRQAGDLRHHHAHYDVNVMEARWHIYGLVNGVIIGSGNGLLPDRQQAITCTNDDMLSIGNSQEQTSMK